MMSSRTFKPATRVLAAPVDVVLQLGCARRALSSEETARKDRFLNAGDRMRFSAAHGLKRLALARCIACHTNDLCFDTNAYGKPFVRENPVQFNISHAGNWVALAVDRTQEVGVDMEIDRADGVWRDVIPAVSAAEDDTITALRLWTAKEALLKAHGTGFALDPRLLSVTARGSEFTGQSQSFEKSGAWCPVGNGHLLAVAGGSGNYDWRIARSTVALDALLDGL